MLMIQTSGCGKLGREGRRRRCGVLSPRDWLYSDREQNWQEDPCSVKEPKERHAAPHSHEPGQLEPSRQELSTLFHTQFQGLQFLFVRPAYYGARASSRRRLRIQKYDSQNNGNPRCCPFKNVELVLFF